MLSISFSFNVLEWFKVKKNDLNDFLWNCEFHFFWLENLKKKYFSVVFFYKELIMG